MITVAIAETNPDRIQKVRDALTTYSIQRDIDLRTFWFCNDTGMQKIERFAASVHIALISLDMSDPRQIGIQFYRNNSECRILYYSEHPCNLENLLCSRPIEFHQWSEDNTVFAEKLDAMIRELCSAHSVFRFQTKRRLLLLPERTIRYFQSNLKQVEIHKADGKIETIVTKLSDLEKQLSNQFVRVHQSFIVNKSMVLSIEKDQRLVKMNNGELIPISTARYDQTLAQIEQLWL